MMLSSSTLRWQRFFRSSLRVSKWKKRNHWFLQPFVKSFLNGSGLGTCQNQFQLYQLNLFFMPITPMDYMPLLYPGLCRSTFLRLGGAGYHTLSRTGRGSKYNRMKRLDSMWSRIKLPLDLWLGRGHPLNPYLKGEWIRSLGRASWLEGYT